MCRLKTTSCISGSVHSQNVERLIFLVTNPAEESRRYCIIVHIKMLLTHCE